MKLVLIDTSAWVQAIRKKGKEEIKEKVGSAIKSRSARICEPVLLELYNGAHGNEEIKTLKKIEQTVDLLFSNQDSWTRAIKYTKTLRSSAYTIPAIDIIIQAIGDENGAEILAYDKHFDIMKKALNL